MYSWFLFFICICGLHPTLTTSTSKASFSVETALNDLGVDISQLPLVTDQAKRSSSLGRIIACASLKVLYGERLITQDETAQFDNFTGSYWSKQQAELSPRCIFKPNTSSEVAIQILISRLARCPFAVKSGGHAAFEGASSIDGGITVSLQNFRNISVASDKKLAIITPGNTWFNVYTELHHQDVVVIGGRVSAIGVGGLTLGGGISFFSNLFGWACDNVISYEVVLANGSVITASADVNEDLHWALRGGGNNFGIVTSFTVNAFPLEGGLMWGGPRTSLEPTFPALIQAFYNQGTTGAEKDPNAAQILSFALFNSTRIASVSLEYAKPIANTSIFEEYLSIPAIADETGIRTLTNITEEFAASNPDGIRDSYWVAVFKLSIEMANFTKNTFFDEVESLPEIPGFLPSASLQVITIPQLQAMSLRGGNPLGLSVEDGPFLLFNMSPMWFNKTDDEKVLKAHANIIQRCVEFAKQNGYYEDYLYMNYASQYQDVIASYGSENKARLKQIAQKYDPEGVFQKLQPGYFKLDGPPKSSMP